MGRCVLKIFSFFSSRLMFRGILITKWYIQCSDKVKLQGNSRCYLLKVEKEDLPEMLSLLKIGLGISFSCDLLPWWLVTYAFSRWPHLSGLGRHGRYWAYRPATHNGSADHFCWWSEGRRHRPVQTNVRDKWRTLWCSRRDEFGFVPRFRLPDSFHSGRCSKDWQLYKRYVPTILTTTE